MGGKKKAQKKSQKKAQKEARQSTVGDVCDALERIAPLRLAQDWDNVGLLAGDRRAPVGKALFCIDMMPAVVDEALAAKTHMVVAYHPPIFRPISRLVAPSRGMEEGVLRCIRKGIAVYSPHTALDAADGGTNDVLAALCGVVDAQPLSRDVATGSACKIVVFVPLAHVDAVADAMFAAGGGIIGEYGSCSFRIDGTGTFFGSDEANPALGKRGRLERVAEQRIEMVCPRRRLSQVVDAMTRAHPYEEVAHDIYPLETVAATGIGRMGSFDKPITLAKLAKKLQKRTAAGCVSVVGDPKRQLRRAVVGVGAAGPMLLSAPLDRHDVIVTGEMRHHDALQVERIGCSAVVMSHWSSERPALSSLAASVEKLAGIGCALSAADHEPFVRV